MWCVERFDDDEALHLYSSKIKYKGNIRVFKTKNDAIEYLYKHGANDKRTECPNCHIKRVMKPYPSRFKERDVDTTCSNCGFHYIRKK